MNEFTCSKCQQKAKFFCERCLEPYCSSECQVVDWFTHKNKCYSIPNLVPMQILSAASNLSLNSRRHYGSKDSLNDNRRSVGGGGGAKSRNLSETAEAKASTRPKALTDDQFALVPKISKENKSANVQKIANWRVEHPPSRDYFVAVVQFIEEVDGGNRFIWVTDVNHCEALERMLADINRNVNKKEPCRPDLIVPGALVCTPFQKILYRAEILDCDPESEKATIRLFDYGNELRLSYNQIFAPIPIATNLNAYTIRGRLMDDCGPLKLESKVTIKVVGPKQSDGYYNIKFKSKSVPLELQMELLSKVPSLSVVKYFADGRNALLTLNDVKSLNMDEVLNSAQGIQYEFDCERPVGTFVAALVQNSWKRASLLGFSEKCHKFLVYCIDEGRVLLTSQIKRIPDEFISQHMKVFAVTADSPDDMFETMLATAKNLSLELLPSTSAIAGKNAKTHVSCALYDDKSKIVDFVVASLFTGTLEELNIPLWDDRIEENAIVYISHVLTYKEIYVALAESKDYAQIFYWEKCEPFKPNEDIEKGDIILVSDAAGNKYRAQVLSFDVTGYKIINIDTGSEHISERKYLYKPTQLVRSLPVCCSLVKLMHLAGINTNVANNKALAALETCMENQTEFVITYEEKKINTIDLLLRTKERQSLVKKLLPMVFEAAEGNLEAAVASSASITPAKLPEKRTLPPTSPETPIVANAPVAIPTTSNVNSGNMPPKIYTLDDLEVIPIECGDNASIYVFDYARLANFPNPYVTAGDANNLKCFKKLEFGLKSVADYCDQAIKSGYVPKKLELCLAIFDDDKQWYRAVCIDNLPNDTFKVGFFDYGNTSIVHRKNIMPITNELMFPTNANVVFFEGITTKEQAIEFAQVLESNPIVKVKLAPHPDGYVAKLPAQ